MFCQNCGAQIPNDSKVCPICGVAIQAANSSFTNDVNRAANDANQFFNSAESSLGRAFDDIHAGLGSGNLGPNGPRLATDRSLLTYIILTIITCGIYGFWFIYTMARDVNVACEGDGSDTTGLVGFIILSYLTCGLYQYYWQYKLGNRLADNAYRYGMHFQENGTTVLLWDIFGAMLCGIGPLVAMSILIRNTNTICGAYNRAHGYGA
ncbi:MAG: DUF4234 domain-containing protein [Lachnospiraceae bacterium]|nr:DUF4234 domain-containing protein [Lachnospiraceae bacterium]